MPVVQRASKIKVVYSSMECHKSVNIISIKGCIVHIVVYSEDGGVKKHRWGYIFIIVLFLVLTVGHQFII